MGTSPQDLPGEIFKEHGLGPLCGEDALCSLVKIIVSVGENQESLFLAGVMG